MYSVSEEYIENEEVLIITEHVENADWEEHKSVDIRRNPRTDDILQNLGTVRWLIWGIMHKIYSHKAYKEWGDGHVIKYVSFSILSRYNPYCHVIHPKNSMPVNNHYLSLFHLLKFGQAMIIETEQNEQWVKQFYDFLKQSIASNLINLKGGLSGRMTLWFLKILELFSL